MNEKQRATLILGLLLVACCALFPARRYTDNTLVVNGSTVAPRSFVWHRQLHRVGPIDSNMEVEIDTAKLIAEVIVIAALAGVAFVRET